jgi:hypothetical protein
MSSTHRKLLPLVTDVYGTELQGRYMDSLDDGFGVGAQNAVLSLDIIVEFE